MDERINQRAAEGWELVTYTHVAGRYDTLGHYLVTFRKEVAEEGTGEE